MATLLTRDADPDDATDEFLKLLQNPFASSVGHTPILVASTTELLLTFATLAPI